MKKILFSILASLFYFNSVAQWIPQTTGNSNIFTSVYFSRLNDGLAVDAVGGIYKTTNAGVTWTLITTAAQPLNSVFLSDTLHGCAVGNSGTILLTTDGGISWAPQTSGTGADLRATFWVSNLLGMAAGTGGTIVMTNDGGATWNPQPSGTTHNLQSIHWPDTNHGFVVGDSVICTITGSITAQANPSFLRSVFFTDTLIGYTSSLGGTIQKTIDGGLTWNNLTSGTPNDLNSIRFTDANNGFAVGVNGTILNTIDAGATWTTQNSNTMNTLYSVNFTSLMNGTIVGQYGTVLHTNNGGINVPIAHFFSNSPGCSGGNINYSDSTLNTPTSWTWSFSGGTPSTSTAQNPVVTYGTAGTYTTSLVATNAYGSSITYTNMVTINPAPTVNAGADQTICATTSTVALNGSSSTGTGAWSTGGFGTFSPTIINLNASYNVVAPDVVAGFVKLALMSTNNGSCPAATDTVLISIQKPLASIGTSTTSTCLSNSINFTDLSSVNTGSITNYMWNFGDGGTSTLQNPSYAYSLGGNYSVRLIVTTNTSCVDSAFKNVVSKSDTLSGFVTDTNNIAVTSGKVYVFTKNFSHAGLLDTMGYTTITAGKYAFACLDTGFYIIKVVADAITYPTSIPNYYSISNPYAYQWDSATVVNITSYGTNLSGKDIKIIQTPAIGGPGQISGQVTAGPGYGQRIGHNHYGVTGAPLKGVDIKLGKNPGGSAVARTTSDNNGNYVFTNIPIGSYKIYVDIPNYGMDSVIAINLTPIDTISAQNNYYVDSAKVRVDTCANPIITFTMVQNASPSTWDVFPTYSLTANAVWYWGDGSSTAGLYPSHTYAAPGRYNICVSAFSACGDSTSFCESDTIYRTTAGMVQVNVINGSIGVNTYNNKVSEVSAYPNPSNGNITLKAKTELGLVTIYNSLGQVVFKEKINASIHQIDLRKQAPGIYLINAQNNFIRLIKE